MTPLENKLRSTLRQTADEIPASAPPLRLTGEPRPGRQRPWLTWVAPLAAAAVVLVVVAGSLALTRGERAISARAGVAGVPKYYVALTGPATSADGSRAATTAEVRLTATGAVFARVNLPATFGAFTGVTAAAGDRTFVIAAEGKNRKLTEQQLDREYPQGYTPPVRLFRLRVNPGGGRRVTLDALPARFVPAHATLHDMALSPDGGFLAADISGDVTTTLGSRLYLFNLATGTSRSWTYVLPHGETGPGTDGLGYVGVTPDALSWTADGKHLAFIGYGVIGRAAKTLRLLDVTAPGHDLIAGSRLAASLPPDGDTNYLAFRGALITPDGRTAVIVEEAARLGKRPALGRWRLLKVSVATGRVTVLNDLDFLSHPSPFEQVMYASADGSTLVVQGARGNAGAGILHGGAYTPIPWSPRTVTAVW